MKNLLKYCVYLILIIAFVVYGGDSAFASTLKFAQISDIHYSSVRPDNSYKLLSKSGDLLKDAIEQINKEKNVKFTVLTGDSIDIADEQSIDNFLEIINTLNIPWYYTIGNHDTNPNDFLTKQQLLAKLNEKNNNYIYTKPYYTFKPQRGYRVIVLDGASEVKRCSNGEISKEQLLWLNNVLKKSKRDVVLIFIHFPLYPPFDSPNHEIINADELKAVLKQYKMPIAMFTGHYHMTRIIKKGNIVLVSTPSLAGFPNAFRIIEIDKSRKNVTYNIRLLETNLKDIQTKAKFAALGGATYYGRPSDRNTTITIKRKK